MRRNGREGKTRDEGRNGRGRGVGKVRLDLKT